MQTHRAFVLRCWCEGETPPDGHPDWRFSLIEIGGEQRPQGFANLQRLVAFLTSEVIGQAEERRPEEGSL